jgi:hypothetical protein
MDIEDLLVPRHPHPRLHAQQVQALQQLPEAERAEQAQLLRVGNAAYRYHQLADGHLTEADFHHWLAGLPPRMRQMMLAAGFASANGNWAFRRHVLERRDHGYSAFMQQQLSADDWAFLQRQEDTEPA